MKRFWDRITWYEHPVCDCYAFKMIWGDKIYLTRDLKTERVILWFFGAPIG